MLINMLYHFLKQFAVVAVVLPQPPPPPKAFVYYKFFQGSYAKTMQ